MEKIVCQTCLDAKTTLRCGICDEASCKTCSQIIDEDAFSFLPEVPDELTKGVYCHSCFESRVSEAKAHYDRTMEAAKNIDVFTSEQGKETSRIPRSKTIKYVIDKCESAEELTMRFAFRAVLDGFNSIVDVNIIAEKIRNGSYQTTNYKGSAVPANVEAKHIIKDKSFRHNPN